MGREIGGGGRVICTAIVSSFMPPKPKKKNEVFTLGKVKGKVCIRAKWPIRPELIPVSVS